MGASVATLRILGTVTVTTAGTPVQIFAGVTPYPRVSSISIRAHSANTGVVYVGDDSVDASTQEGQLILESDEKYFSGDNGNSGGTTLLSIEDLYVDSTVSGDKVIVTYLEVE